jgi:hypothetical protein
MEILGSVSAAGRGPQRGTRVGVEAVGPRRQCKKDGQDGSASAPGIRLERGPSARVKKPIGGDS